MKRLITLLLICLFSLSVAACNTTRGFGQDVEQLGDTIEDAATRNGGNDDS
jgi:predicted small secreted protein